MKNILIFIIATSIFAACKSKGNTYIDEQLFIKDIQRYETIDSVHYCRFWAGNKDENDHFDWCDFKAPCNCFTIDQEIVIQAKSVDIEAPTQEQVEKDTTSDFIMKFLK